MMIFTCDFMWVRSVIIISFVLSLTGCERSPSAAQRSGGERVPEEGSLLDSMKDGLSKLSGLDEVEAKEAAHAAEQEADQKLYDVMEIFMADEGIEAEKWMMAGQAIQIPEMLNCAVLNTKETFDSQRKTLQTYVGSSKAYATFSESVVERLTEELEPLKAINAPVEEAIKEVKEDYLEQKPVFDQLLKAHVSYGQTMIEILDLLENNQDEWVFSEGETVIYHNRVLKEFGRLQEKLDEYGMIINEMSAQLN